MPVLIPGATMTGLTSKYLMILLVRECITSGTTDAMITESTSLMLKPLSISHSPKNTPNSSEVLEVLVIILNVLTSSLPSKSPMVKFVFPTSIAKSIS